MEEPALKRLYLLPNVITAFGLSCGLFVIFKMAMISSSELSPYMLSQIAGVLLLAALADVTDGAIARAMHAESEFGSLFDSLADAVTFGVAPSVVVLKTANVLPGSFSSFCMTTAAMLFSLSGVLRLVRYNVMNSKKAENPSSPPPTYFIGLPIPAAAAAIVSANLLIVSELPHTWIWAQPLLLFVSMTTIAYLMISKVVFFSLKSLRMRIASFQVLVGTTCSAAFTLYGILHYFSLFFFTIAWGYILLALLLAKKYRSAT